MLGRLPVPARVLLIWIRVGQGPTALAVGAGGDCSGIFSLLCHFSFLSPFLWETVGCFGFKVVICGKYNHKNLTYLPEI